MHIKAPGIGSTRWQTSNFSQRTSSSQANYKSKSFKLNASQPRSSHAMLRGQPRCTEANQCRIQFGLSSTKPTVQSSVVDACTVTE